MSAICPKCGANDAYLSPFKGWSCVRSTCEYFDSSAVSKQDEPKEVVATRVPDAPSRIYWEVREHCGEDNDSEGEVSIFATEEEAWREAAGLMLKKDFTEEGESLSLSEYTEIFDHLNQKEYKEAVKIWNKNCRSYYEIEVTERRFVQPYDDDIIQEMMRDLDSHMDDLRAQEEPEEEEDP